MRVVKRRRKQGKTDYKGRASLLKSGLARIALRRSNKYFTAQYIKSDSAQDSIIIGVNSKSLLKYGWPENKKGGLKSKIAGYLTGFLLGRRVIDKEGKGVNAILDIGLRESIPKSRVYFFAKGLKEAGINLKVNENMLPEIKSEEINIEKIKKDIEKF